MSDSQENRPLPASTPTGNLSPDIVVAKTLAGQEKLARRRLRSWFALREQVPAWQAILLGAFCIALVFGLWHVLTVGETVEDRIMSPIVLPSISETFDSFHSLWFDSALTRNTLATLRTVFFGFVLAGVIGIPLGVLAGCFPRFNAFLSPLMIFGRNIPVAAIVPILLLSLTWFDFSDRKILFIFVACVAFVISDTARAIADVRVQYIDTAYTLGASTWQTIIKVLFPMALPQILDSFRIMFGLAFGYIMLAECIAVGGEAGGIGHLIYMFQRVGKRPPIVLIILIIPLVAFAIDRVLFWMQKQLFPHLYGGDGLLIRAVRVVFHAWDDFKRLIYKPVMPPELRDLPRKDALKRS